MSWIDTPSNNRYQNTQVVAHGSINDIDRIKRRDEEEYMNNKFLLFGFFIFAISFIMFYIHKYGLGLFFLLLSILVFVILCREELIYLYYKIKHNNPHRYN